MIRFADKAGRVTADSRLIVMLILVASDQRLLQRLLRRGYLSILFRCVCIGIGNESASRRSLYGTLPRIRMLIFGC